MTACLCSVLCAPVYWTSGERPGFTLVDMRAADVLHLPEFVVPSINQQFPTVLIVSLTGAKSSDVTHLRMTQGVTFSVGSNR